MGLGYTEILQENHYYAFGMNMEGPWRQPFAPGTVNGYQYNGKELNSDLGLGWYNYGARMYDPPTCRFTGVDPLAADYAAWGTYVYVLNNPVRFVDPDGRAPSDANPPGKVIAVFYHGGPTGGGNTTTAAKAGTAGDIYNFTAQSAASAGRSFTGRVIAPGATSASGVENGLGFIKDNYNDGDQVIIYGYVSIRQTPPPEQPQSSIPLAGTQLGGSSSSRWLRG